MRDHPGSWFSSRFGPRSIPWAVVALASASLLVAAASVLAGVPARLSAEARAVVAESGESGIELEVDGRDLALAGVISGNADRQALIERLAAIPGMRVVRDGLDVLDPAAESRERKRAFGEALSGLDLSGVAFEPGRSAFAPGSGDALEALHRLLLGNPRFRVRIAGHTDDTGRPEINLRLSRERAAEVRTWLVSRGIGDARVIAQGYGSTQPVADNATEAGRARNRRIEVRYVD